MKSRESHIRGEEKLESHASAHEPGYDQNVSETDVEGWAARERAERRAWLEGPSEEEKKDWAERERRRRAARADRGEFDGDEYEGRRIAERWRRDMELVLIGLAGRIIEPPYALLGNMVREGRRFEDELNNSRRRRSRKRVLPDDDI